MDKEEQVEALDRLGNDHLRLESRVYSLEKEMALCMNILTIGLVVGGYFFYRWYLENFAHTIPGVISE